MARNKAPETPKRSPGRPSRSTTAFSLYLQSRGMTHDEAAAQLELHPVYVSQLCTGIKTPSLQLAHAIFSWSKGAVPMEAWLAFVPE